MQRCMRPHLGHGGHFLAGDAMSDMTLTMPVCKKGVYVLRFMSMTMHGTKYPIAPSAAHLTRTVNRTAVAEKYFLERWKRRDTSRQRRRQCRAGQNRTE